MPCSQRHNYSCKEFSAHRIESMGRVYVGLYLRRPISILLRSDRYSLIGHLYQELAGLATINNRFLR